MDSVLIFDFKFFFDTSDKKGHTVKARSNPFDECDEVELKIRSRLSKSTVQKLPEQFSV